MTSSNNTKKIELETVLRQLTSRRDFATNRGLKAEELFYEKTILEIERLVAALHERYDMEERIRRYEEDLPGALNPAHDEEHCACAAPLRERIRYLENAISTIILRLAKGSSTRKSNMEFLSKILEN